MSIITPITFYIPCLFGLEGLVGDELRRLNMKNIRVENGHVLCDGTMEDIARLNINLRCGERVLILLNTFFATSFDALFENTKALPWENWVGADGAFPVKGYSLDSALHSVPDCQKIIKKAIATRLAQKFGTNQLPETGAKYQVQFAIMQDRASLFLDTSGAGLHKRGYRAVGVKAPLRETLAAAMVTVSRFRGKDPFCDPFCGSGTIAIEAALIAKNRAPGLDRGFDAQKWSVCPPQAGWMLPMRQWIKNLTALMTFGAAISVPKPSRLQEAMPKRQALRIWCALKWQMRQSSIATAPTVSW